MTTETDTALTVEILTIVSPNGPWTMILDTEVDELQLITKEENFWRDPDFVIPLSKMHGDVEEALQFAIAVGYKCEWALERAVADGDLEHLYDAINEMVFKHSSQSLYVEALS